MPSWDMNSLIQRFRRPTRYARCEQNDGMVAVPETFSLNRRHKGRVIVFTNADPSEVCLEPGQTARDICALVAKEVGISIKTLELFGLVHVSKDPQPVNSHKKLLEEDCQKTYEFRLIFKVCTASQFLEYDENTFKYYFHQLLADFNKGNSPEPRYTEENKKFYVMLAIIEIVLQAQKKNISPWKIFERKIKQDLLIWKGYFKDYNKQEIKKYLKEGNKLDSYNRLSELDLMKNFMHVLEQSEEFFIHKFVVYKNYPRAGSTKIIQRCFELHISAQEGIQLKDDNGVTQDVVKCFSELLSLDVNISENEVLISRKEEGPERIQTRTLVEAQAIVTLVEGYYRLMVNRYIKLSDIEFRLSSVPRIFGSIIRKKAVSFLQKAGGEDGTFLLRQSNKKFDEYVLSILSNNDDKHYEITASEGKYFLKRTNDQKSFPDIEALVKYYRETQNGLPVCLGRRCFPPTEGYEAMFDFHPIVPITNRPQDISDYRFEVVDRNQLHIKCTLGTGGEFGNVKHGEWMVPDAEQASEIITRCFEKKVLGSEFCKAAEKLVELRHQNVARLHGIAVLEKSYALIAEYVPLGPLDSYLSQRCDSGLLKYNVVSFALQLTEGMIYLETKGIVHGRLAAHNVLVAADECLKITDVGLRDLASRGGVFLPDRPHQKLNSHCWYALEILPDPHRSEFTHKSDVWSLGVSIWEMFTLRRPFHPMNSLDPLSCKQILLRYSKGLHLNVDRPSIPKEVSEIIKHCWDHCEERRISFSDIYNRLHEAASKFQGDASTIHRSLEPEDWEQELMKRQNKPPASAQLQNMSSASGYEEVKTLSPDIPALALYPSLNIANKQSLHRTLSDPGSPPGHTQVCQETEVASASQRKISLSRTTSYPSMPSSRCNLVFSPSSDGYARMSNPWEMTLDLQNPLHQESLQGMEPTLSSDHPALAPENSQSKTEEPPPLLSEGAPKDTEVSLRLSEELPSIEYRPSGTPEGVAVPDVQSTPTVASTGNITDKGPTKAQGPFSGHNYAAARHDMDLQLEDFVDTSSPLDYLHNESESPLHPSLSEVKEDSLPRADQGLSCDLPHMKVASMHESPCVSTSNQSQTSRSEERTIPSPFSGLKSGCMQFQTKQETPKRSPSDLIVFEASVASKAIDQNNATVETNDSQLLSQPIEYQTQLGGLGDLAALVKQRVPTGISREESGPPCDQPNAENPAFPLSDLDDFASLVEQSQPTSVSSQAEVIQATAPCDTFSSERPAFRRSLEDLAATEKQSLSSGLNALAAFAGHTESSSCTPLKESGQQGSDDPSKAQKSINSYIAVELLSTNHHEDPITTPMEQLNEDNLQEDLLFYHILSKKGESSADTPNWNTDNRGSDYVDTSVSLLTSGSDCRSAYIKSMRPGSCIGSQGASVNASVTEKKGRDDNVFEFLSNLNAQGETNLGQNEDHSDTSSGAKITSGILSQLSSDTTLISDTTEATMHDQSRDTPSAGYVPHTGAASIQSRDTPSAGYVPHTGAASIQSRDTSSAGYVPHTGAASIQSRDTSSAGYVPHTGAASTQSRDTSSAGYVPQAVVLSNLSCDIASESQKPQSTVVCKAPPTTPSDGGRQELCSPLPGPSSSSEDAADAQSRASSPLPTGSALQEDGTIRSSALIRLNKKITPDLRINLAELHFMEKPLGKGQFGVVKKAKRVYENKGQTHKSDVAVKELNPNVDEKDEIDFINEAEIMIISSHQIKSRNIIQLIGICIDMERLSIKIVTELAPYGALPSYLREKRDLVQVPRLMEFCLQIAEAMEALHRDKCIHRDLAARNILVVKENLVKISDFGLSRLSQYYKTDKGKFPTRWYAPECLEFLKFTAKSDVWSFGVTMWEMFEYGGARPYQEIEDAQQVLPHLRRGNRLARPSTCPEDMYELLKKCWYNDPNLRPSSFMLTKEIKRLIDNLPS
ncbi:uncharacterized protein LOC5516063 isoform X2 [Nematostella vectensis]|uniref:uncharacterized protein LOC5516063 isoform X2 n=1 Tax=Nematostella vectensis TaxID=45351 RepID=UPI002077824D|nr:uncharacterized protein LOC5516063 isoform X2 [Nematostella vectensis]